MKPGESALESDSGVPTELRDPGSGLDVASGLGKIKKKQDKISFPIMETRCQPSQSLSVMIQLFFLYSLSFLDVSKAFPFNLNERLVDFTCLCVCK